MGTSFNTLGKFIWAVNNCDQRASTSERAGSILFFAYGKNRAFWIWKTLKTIKTTRPFRPRVFIVFRVSQILENNKNCLANSLVNSIVLACLETLVKHSHSFMKYYVIPRYACKEMPFRRLYIRGAWPPVPPLPIDLFIPHPKPVFRLPWKVKSVFGASLTTVEIEPATFDLLVVETRHTGSWVFLFRGKFLHGKLKNESTTCDKGHCKREFQQNSLFLKNIYLYSDISFNNGVFSKLVFHYISIRGQCR